MSCYDDDAWQSMTIIYPERMDMALSPEDDNCVHGYWLGAKHGPLADYEKAEAASFNPKLFVTKDSGQRESYGGGMQRDTATGKIRPDLVKDGPMYLRWVGLMTRGALKYAARNWMKAAGREEYDRFLESAARHYEIWYAWRCYGINIEDMDNPTTEPPKEDHAAAVYFNINGCEFVADKIASDSFLNDPIRDGN